MTSSCAAAAVVQADDESVQALIAATVAEWRGAGVNAVGVVAAPHRLPGRTCRAGTLNDIASGRIYRIYLETPPSDTSCHLDAQGVHAACEGILEQIASCDLVVLSKFGKLEAAGEGLAPAFSAAIDAGKPLLTTVSERHRAAWHAFASDAIDLNAEPQALRAWWESLREVRA